MQVDTHVGGFATSRDPDDTDSDCEPAPTTGTGTESDPNSCPQYQEENAR